MVNFEMSSNPGRMVSAMSDNAVGSQAFARYREMIDGDMCRGMIDTLAET